MAIYFLAAPQVGRVKIGYSDAPERRIQEIRLMCPVPVELIAVVGGSYKDEAALHRRFADLRRHGEWFDDVPEIRAEMMRLLAGALADQFTREQIAQLIDHLGDIIKEREAA